LIDFENSFTCIFSRKFAIKRSFKITLHLKPRTPIHCCVEGLSPDPQERKGGKGRDKKVAEKKKEGSGKEKKDGKEKGMKGERGTGREGLN